MSAPLPPVDPAAATGGAGEAAFLGVLQGLTEFLPVSSSGHLVLFQQFLSIGGDHVLFDVVLHVGTLIPVLWVYRANVKGLVLDPLFGEGEMTEREGVRLLAMLLLASIPTALIGLALEDVFERLFATPAVLTITFAITGALLFFTRNRQEGAVGLTEMSWKIALILGVAQGLAITPGISRSGTTIAVALVLGLRREFAARFSFLMSVPAITGAVLLKLIDADLSMVDPTQLAVGGLTAMVSGYAALVILIRLVKGGNLSHFAWYCWAAAFAAGAIAAWRLTAVG